MTQKASTAKTTDYKSNATSATANNAVLKTPSSISPQEKLLQLHRQYGNSAVRRMYESRVLQAKLEIGQPNDRYKQEADRGADRVMNLPGPDINRQEKDEEEIQTNPLVDQITPLVQRQAEEEEPVQTQGSRGTSPKMSPSVENGFNSIRGRGHPLPQSSRAFFEPRFGADFSGVRIHTGSNANSLARRINAKAFTVGKDIVFRSGQFSLNTASGKRLLAHELTHTVQQTGGYSMVQRGGAGLFGGKCCNRSEGEEWALVGDGEWKKIKTGTCTESLEDCDGMTCGGGFYRVDNMKGGACITPRKDDSYFKPRRWTPDIQGPDAKSPVEEGSKNGNTPPGYSYDKAPAGALPYEIGGNKGSTKIIRIAWTFDDGPTPKTASMKSAIGLKRTTWFVMYNEIKGKGPTDERTNLANLKKIQTDGGEVGIHSYHETKKHVAWFPMSTKTSYSDVDVSMSALSKFYNYLKAAGIVVKFVRLPFGLISELAQWLKDKAVPNAFGVASAIIKKKYTGTNTSALTVKKGFEKVLSKLKALGLHLWGGSGGTAEEVAAQSWEAESSGVSGRADYITKHVSADRAAQQANVTDPKKKDNPGKFERVTDLIVSDGRSRSLIVLAHDVTAKDVAEVSADKAAMEAYAASKGVKIEYYTMSGLYTVLRGKTP